MKKTFFLNFNQINRDLFMDKFSNSLTEKVSILDVGSGNSLCRNLFKNHEFKTHDFFKYTVGYHVVAIKDK